MEKPKNINRRDFIVKTGLGSAVILSWPLLNSCQSSSYKATNSELSGDFKPDIDIELSAAQSEKALFPGDKTKVWTYESKLINGDKESLQNLPDSFLGPVIRVKKGQKIRIRFKNKLPEKTIVHWHGMHVPEKYDGHPKDVIDQGETYVYEYEVMNRAGTYWFHPHPHGRTGPQVYNGLAGLILVTDEEEQQLNLPQGEFDLPVVIQDRSFDDNNQLVYLNNGRMDQMTGFLGDKILINGDPEKILNLKSGCSYRLRFLNGSNSRIYKLAWSDGSPVKIFGIDGSLLTTPEELPYLMLGPAKRADVWLDLTNKPEGTELVMKNATFPLEVNAGGMMDDGGMMMEGNGTSLPQGSEYTVLKIQMNYSGSNDYSLPEQLVKQDYLDPSTAENLSNPRQFVFAMGHMEWTINGRTWETTGVADDEIVKLGSTEVWELINSENSGGDDGHGMMGGGGMHGGGMMGNMMSMAHPIHIHQLQFNILERNIDEVDPELWNAVKDGFVKNGWHDTVLLMPGMKAKVIMQFNDFKGLFIYHCHNLEHEDMGMMRNFKIVE